MNKNIPKCKNCGKKDRWYDTNAKEYSEFCSISCRDSFGKNTIPKCKKCGKDSFYDTNKNEYSEFCSKTCRDTFSSTAPKSKNDYYKQIDKLIKKKATIFYDKNTLKYLKQKNVENADIMHLFTNFAVKSDTGIETSFYIYIPGYFPTNENIYKMFKFDNSEVVFHIFKNLIGKMHAQTPPSIDEIIKMSDFTPDEGFQYGKKINLDTEERDLWDKHKFLVMKYICLNKMLNTLDKNYTMFKYFKKEKRKYIEISDRENPWGGLVINGKKQKNLLGKVYKILYKKYKKYKKEHKNINKSDIPGNFFMKYCDKWGNKLNDIMKPRSF